MLSTCMQGQTGPNAMYPGFGQLMAALSGFYYISGYGHGQLPAPPYGAYSDFVAPRFFRFGAARRTRLSAAHRQGPVHRHVAVRGRDCRISRPRLIDYFATGRELGPRGNASKRYAPHGAYRCADEDGNERWIAIAVANDEQWHAMLTALARNFKRRTIRDASHRVSKTRETLDRIRRQPHANSNAHKI